MTPKKVFLSIYPDAHLKILTGPSLNRYSNKSRTLYVVMKGQPAKPCGVGSTEGKAWTSAWNLVQKNMLKALEQ